MSVRYYLAITHNVVAETFLKTLILKIGPIDKSKHQQDLEYIFKVKGYEFGRNLSIKTLTNLNHNKPDIIA